jgi:hypothetical protein
MWHKFIKLVGEVSNSPVWENYNAGSLLTEHRKRLMCGFLEIDTERLWLLPVCIELPSSGLSMLIIFALSEM